MTQYQTLEGNTVHSDCHDELSYTLFYPQACLARSEVSVPSVTGWQRWNCISIRSWNSRFSNNTRNKAKSANNEWEGSDQNPYSQTSIKEPNVKNFEPVQTSVATRSNTSTLTKAAVWNHAKFLSIFSELFKKHLVGTFLLCMKLSEFYYLATKELQWFRNKGMKTSIARFYMLVSWQQWLHNMFLWGRNITSFTTESSAATSQNKAARYI